MSHGIERAAYLVGTVLLVGAVVVLVQTVRKWQDPTFSQPPVAFRPFAELLDHSRSEAASQAKASDAPLIKAAKDLALYLSPPPKPKPARKSSVEARIAAVPALEAGPETPSPKFELHGISYHRSRPEASMAMVWMPDTGRRWVRQGTRVGHIVIEQIEPDRIVYRGGETRREMALDMDKASETFAQYFRPTLPLRISDAPRQANSKVAPRRRYLLGRSQTARTDRAAPAGSPARRSSNGRR